MENKEITQNNSELTTLKKGFVKQKNENYTIIDICWQHSYQRSGKCVESGKVPVKWKSGAG